MTTSSASNRDSGDGRPSATTPAKTLRNRPSVHTKPWLNAKHVRAVAHARGREVLLAAGLGRGLLVRRHAPCPKCGGRDRFRVADADVGRLFCNRCFDKRNGDVSAAVGWLLGLTFPDAVRCVADVIGAGADTSTAAGKPHWRATIRAEAWEVENDAARRAAVRASRLAQPGALERAATDLVGDPAAARVLVQLLAGVDRRAITFPMWNDRPGVTGVRYRALDAARATAGRRSIGSGPSPAGRTACSCRGP